MTDMIPGLRFEKTNETKKDIVNISIKEQISELLKLELDDETFKSRVETIMMETNTASDAEISDKMSASDTNSKIDMLDDKSALKRKINKAYCLPGDIDDNCLLALTEKIIWPILHIKNVNFNIYREVRFGGKLAYSSNEDGLNLLKSDFKAEKLYPGDLKIGIIDALDLILSPIREIFNEKENHDILKKAYS
jgi:tyrosyl-tRNA synthetase